MSIVDISKEHSICVSGSMVVYERCRHHMSQKTLENYLGISVPALRKIERGEKVPDETVKAKLREEFGAERFEGCWEGGADGR